MKNVVLCISAVVLLVAGALYFIFGIDLDARPFVPPKGTVLLRISPETTIVTEPLLPNGNAIDFFAVLDQKCSAGADSEENGFREIVRLVGRSIFGNISDGKWKILCEKLNLNPDDPPRFHYEPLPIEIASSLWHDEVPAESLERLERWVTEMEPAISAVTEALKRPLYIMPTLGELELPDGPFKNQILEWNLDVGGFPDFFTAPSWCPFGTKRNYENPLVSLYISAN